MSESSVIQRLNAHRPRFIGMLGGTIVAVNQPEQSCTFEFMISTDFCHSIDVVQGGFITVMLDAAMSHAVFASGEDISGLSSLDINTTYLEPTRAGRLRAVGKIVKCSYKTAFLEARLYNSDGLLTATASSVAKVVRN
ncbi:MAG: PaaI family thioesterase [Halioglobus sp.]|nr:PaaI family thioesterase [Halioglobus sp.]